MKKWIALAGVTALVLYLRGRRSLYIPNEVRNLLWNSEAGRWRTAEEVTDYLREHPERVPLTLLSSEARVLSYLDLIQTNAHKNNLDPALIAAIISKESGGDYTARGAVGEFGLMQVRATTAQMLGFKGDPDLLYNPGENIRYGAAYLAYQLDRYAAAGDPTSYAVSAYNAGSVTIAKGRFSNQGYVDSVMKHRLPRYTLLINRAMGIY